MALHHSKAVTAHKNSINRTVKETDLGQGQDSVNTAF